MIVFERAKAKWREWRTRDKKNLDIAVAVVGNARNADWQSRIGIYLMATYKELFGLRNDSALRNRVLVAVVIAAETVMNEDGGIANHVNRLLWAKAVFANPGSEAARMFWAVLAANNAASLNTIIDATDAAIQANVNDHVDLFADGN